jgi:lambda repressor-like predicted transcriptional regulator
VKSKYRKLKLAHGRTLDEHRHVMQRAVGRSLASSEVVHHINGDGHDNRLENLQVMPLSEHTRLHTIKKLTEAAVTEIRASQKSQRWLAAFYGVHLKTIWTAKHGRTWSHIPVPKIEAGPNKMKYVTVRNLATHTGRHYSTIQRALAASHVAVERPPGVNGKRIPLKAANQMIAIHWPEVAPMGKEQPVEATR